MTWLEKTRKWFEGYGAILQKQLLLYKQTPGDKREALSVLYLPLQKATNRAVELIRTYPEKIPENIPSSQEEVQYFRLQEAFPELVAFTDQAGDAWRQLRAEDAEWYKNVWPYFVDDVEKIGRDIEKIRDQGLAFLKKLTEWASNNPGLSILGLLVVVLLFFGGKIPRRASA